MSWAEVQVAAEDNFHEWCNTNGDEPSLDAAVRFLKSKGFRIAKLGDVGLSPFNWPVFQVEEEL